MMPLMNVLCVLQQAAVETYAALVADIPLTIAAAQAALQLLKHLATTLKK